MRLRHILYTLSFEGLTCVRFLGGGLEVLATMHSLLAPRPVYERSAASIILSYKVCIPVYCAASTLEFSNCHYYAGQEMCTVSRKQF